MNVSKQLLSAALSAAVGLSLVAAAAPASAASVKVGVLNCQVAGGWGFVIGSSKNLRCTFAPVNGPVEHYEGAVSKFGVDIGYTRGAVLVWQVIAPSDHPTRGALEGSYGGVTASASVGLGVGAHALVGGFQRSIALQPLSISGESGLNVAAGIGSIKLRHVS